MNPDVSTAAAPVSLATLHRGDRAVVASVADDESGLGDELGSTLVMRLIEIGFVPGEAVEVIGEARPGGDPLAVRVGGTCFALRRREASAVFVTLVAPKS
ncbi:MAG: FeoA family protein [Steroidobacteraceae bacterium]